MMKHSLSMHYMCFLPPEYQRGEKGVPSQWRNLTNTTSARWSKSVNSDEGHRQSFLPGILQARILQWLPFPSPEELPNPGIKPWPPAWQADSPFELQGSLPSIRCTEKGTSSAAFLPQAPNPSLIMRKTLNPSRGTFYKIADLSILSVKVKNESVSHSIATDYLRSHGL